jgi:hypothetical protein
MGMDMRECKKMNAMQLHAQLARRGTLETGLKPKDQLIEHDKRLPMEEVSRANPGKLSPYRSSPNLCRLRRNVKSKGLLSCTLSLEPTVLVVTY